ncbi:MAG: DNA ligase [Gammaproteobacteria bacterium]
MRTGCQFLLFLLIAISSATFAAGPDLLLLKTYRDDIDPTGWLMSEKLDGVRAVWDGEMLISRGGHAFAAPGWFTVALPPFAIDGELWTRQGDFERISSITRRQTPHEGWRAITYNIFEVPQVAGGLLQRLAKLEDWLAENPVAHLKVIPQRACQGRDDLKAALSEVEAAGGEGLVLRRPDAPYRTGRDEASLKVKRFDDAEAVVVGYRPGKGRLLGKVGALQVELPDGRRFYVGSGLSDAERDNPPAIGERITFKYQGLTGKGLPRFPSFLRVRPAE